ncbi:hypothetical protein FB107DRAFT_225248, partial [Schizophyllum commune]
SPLACTRSPGALSRPIRRPPPNRVVARCSRDSCQTLLVALPALGACLAQ